MRHATTLSIVSNYSLICHSKDVQEFRQHRENRTEDETNGMILVLTSLEVSAPPHVGKVLLITRQMLHNNYDKAESSESNVAMVSYNYIASQSGLWTSWCTMKHSDVYVLVFHSSLWTRRYWDLFYLAFQNSFWTRSRWQYHLVFWSCLWTRLC